MSERVVADGERRRRRPTKRGTVLSEEPDRRDGAAPDRRARRGGADRAQARHGARRGSERALPVLPGHRRPAARGGGRTDRAHPARVAAVRRLAGGPALARPAHPRRLPGASPGGGAHLHAGDRARARDAVGGDASSGSCAGPGSRTPRRCGSTTCSWTRRWRSRRSTRPCSRCPKESRVAGGADLA